MNHAEIVGIDILWYDQLVTLPEMPAENGSVFVEGSSFQGGGKVCSALAAAGRQGIPCKLLAVCGDSRRSRFLVEDLQRHGVDTAAIRQIPGYEEGWSIVLSDAASGGRRILWHHDTRQPGLNAADVDGFAEDIAQAKYLHLCRMDETDRRAARIARSAGTQVCLDADYYSREIRKALPMVDILIGSEEFYRDMFPGGGAFADHVRSILRLGPSTVIFTFGSRGCRGYADGAFFEVPAFQKNIRVVDTVGAGDDFHGGYLAALCMGRTGLGAAHYASAVSAIKCTAIGGRAGIPTRPMVEQYLREGTFPTEEILRRTAYYSTEH